MFEKETADPERVKKVKRTPALLSATELVGSEGGRLPTLLLPQRRV